MGLPDLVIGDLFGSCLANLPILAVLDLMQPSFSGMFPQVQLSIIAIVAGALGLDYFTQ